MKRDALPSTPAPAAQPARVGLRNTPAMINTARAALLEREYTIDELREHIEALHPDRTLDMVRLVERLHELDEIELVADMLGLTDRGETVARRVKDGGDAHQVPRRTLGGHRSPSDLSEWERRAALLPTGQDPQALTRSMKRAAASPADLAPPPPRPGADASLDLPSRIGNRLHYRDGRITDMAGAEIQPAHRLQDYRATRDGSSRVLPAWSRDWI